MLVLKRLCKGGDWYPRRYKAIAEAPTAAVRNCVHFGSLNTKVNKSRIGQTSTPSARLHSDRNAAKKESNSSPTLRLALPVANSAEYQTIAANANEAATSAKTNVI